MGVDIQIKYQYTPTQDSERHLKTLIKFLAEQSTHKGKVRREKDQQQDESRTVLPR